MRFFAPVSVQWKNQTLSRAHRVLKIRANSLSAVGEKEREALKQLAIIYRRRVKTTISDL